MVTVSELQEWLKGFPPDARVRGYEGEGGAWIVVDLPNDESESIQAGEE